MRKKLVVALMTFLGVGALFSAQAGAAVDQNFNWWLDGQGGALHVAADHHTDGVWHVRATLYEYGTGNLIGARMNDWFEDWACISPEHGVPYSTPSKVHFITNDDTMYGPNYCVGRDMWSYRPAPAGHPRPNKLSEDWGRWDWFYDPGLGTGSCYMVADNTGLFEAWGDVYWYNDPCGRGITSVYVRG